MNRFIFILVLSSIASMGFLSFISGKKTTNPPNSSPKNLTSLNKEKAKGVAVMELFTSQGCSSCPPADDLLRGVAKQENVFALSFHVTYWNRLGWQDSFSQKIFDERQYDYSSHFNTQNIYTPQAIINGTIEFVGSRKSQVDKYIHQAINTPCKIDVTLSKVLKDNKFAIHYAFKSQTESDKIDLENTQLNMALVESNLETKIQNGENTGRTLKHDNVVRYFNTTNASHTEGVLESRILDNWQIKNCAVIVFLQHKKTRHVLGAAKINLN
ncbi:MAG: DUF1223 domain-containing protein [Saprospiraceae bacterium]|nr:DUF1223 domain-containing protein [Saprospiraceae bacterium]